MSPFIINNGIFLHPKITIGKIVKTDKNSLKFVAAVFVDKGKEYELFLERDFFKNNQVKLIYNSQNPREAIPFSFSGIFLSKKMAVIVFLFFIISALYFTIKDTKEIKPDEEFLE